MSKLIKSLPGILFMLTLSYFSFGQQRVPIPVQRFNPGYRPVQRPFPRNNNVVVRQNPGGRKLELVKQGFLSRQLNLTSKESKAFWPLYRQYQDELTAVRILKRINNSNSTVDGAKQVELDLQYETQLVDIKKHYKDEFYKILPPEKVSELYKSERIFNDEVLKQLSERSVRAGD